MLKQDITSDIRLDINRDIKTLRQKRTPIECRSEFSQMGIRGLRVKVSKPANTAIPMAFFHVKL